MTEVTASIGDVARRLGVASSTLRTWERRYGVGPSQRTAGAHRRYCTADIARLATFERLLRSGTPPREAGALLTTPTSAPNCPGGTSPDSAPDPGLVERFHEGLDLMDTRQLAAAVHAALLHHGALVTWDELLAPELIRLGENWQQCGIGIGREHVLSEVLTVTLREYARHQETPRMGRNARTPVVLAAAAGEQHTLPLAAVAAGLAERATGSHTLADLPDDDLAGALAELAPLAVLVWARTERTARAATIATAQEHSHAVYTAGPGWPRATTPTDVRHVDTLAEALAALRPEQAHP